MTLYEQRPWGYAIGIGSAFLRYPVSFLLPLVAFLHGYTDLALWLPEVFRGRAGSARCPV